MLEVVDSIREHRDIRSINTRDTPKLAPIPSAPAGDTRLRCLTTVVAHLAAATAAKHRVGGTAGRAHHRRPDLGVIAGDRRFKPHVLARGTGYRSLLTPFTRVGDQMLGVGFWSKHRNAYEPRHLPLARGVLDHFAVAVSQERLASAIRGRATGVRAPASSTAIPEWCRKT